MTTPSGLPQKALQFYGVARGAVANRVSTADFYGALNDAASQFGLEGHGLDFATVTQLRSAAVRVRNAQEAFDRAPGGSAITGDQIGVEPYARSQADRNDSPIYQVGINLHTTDQEGNVSTDYRRINLVGQLNMTKDDLLTLVQQDAEAMAQIYGTEYAGHDVLELLAV